MGKYNKYYENYYKKLNSFSDERNINFYHDENSYMTTYRKKHKSSKFGINIVILFLILGGILVYKWGYSKSGKGLYDIFLDAIGSIELVTTEEEVITTSKDVEEFNDIVNQKNSKVIDNNKKYSEFVSTLSGSKIKAKSEEGLVLSCKYKIIATSLAGKIEHIGENAEGYFLTIDHGNNIKTLYYNLPKIDYVEGVKLKKGEKIAEIKEEREIVFKIKENDKFVTPSTYLDFIE